jgi:c-di-GMP-binding flagellar brake protein YcgR
MIGQDAAEQRISMRFDKAFQVDVFSELFGDMVAVARNISSGGIGLEMQDPLPMGTVVTIRFQLPGDNTALSVRAEVKHQYCFNYNVGDQAASTRGIGLRFLEFLEDSEEHLQQSFTRRRNIH